MKQVERGRASICEVDLLRLCQEPDVCRKTSHYEPRSVRSAISARDIRSRRGRALCLQTCATDIWLLRSRDTCQLLTPKAADFIDRGAIPRRSERPGVPPWAMFFVTFGDDILQKRSVKPTGGILADQFQQTPLVLASRFGHADLYAHIQL